MTLQRLDQVQLSAGGPPLFTCSGLIEMNEEAVFFNAAIIEGESQAPTAGAHGTIFWAKFGQ